MSTFRFKFSTNFQAVKSRIKRLPKLVSETADTIAKKDAVAVIEAFREGIKQNTFNLKPLLEVSRQNKIKQGYSRPSNPLYGKGEDDDRSYINVLKIRKIKNGYRIFLSWKKHHSGNISLRLLFFIHEKGAIIRVTEKMRVFLHVVGIHLKTTTNLIRIPPRPTFRKAFNRALRRKARQENVDAVKKAILQIIKTGNSSGFNKIKGNFKNRRRFDEA